MHKIIEMSIIAGLLFSYGGWLIYSDADFKQTSWLALFLFGTVIMAVGIIGAQLIERLFKLKTYMSSVLYQEIKAPCDINKLILVLYQVGFVLKKNNQNNYWFKTSNFIIFKSSVLVRDHGEYCTVLIKKTDVKPLTSYIELLI